MQDNDQIKIFLPIIKAGLTADGFTGVNVIQTNQPTIQGIPTTPTVYFYKLRDHRYGFLKRNSAWDSLTSTMVHTEQQVYETTWQISALVRQAVTNPTPTTTYTASDLVNEVAAIIQSDSTRAILNAADLGILRVMDISNAYFKDDRDNFEAIPAFEFVLTHKQTRVTSDPVVESVQLNIKQV